MRIQLVRPWTKAVELLLRGMAVIGMLACAPLLCSAEKPLQILERQFTSLFNGHDLAGWSGDPEIWSVRAGAITAERRRLGPRTNYWLVSERGDVADFELRYQVRVIRTETNWWSNAGVVFRGVKAEGGDIHGYLADNATPNKGDTKFLELGGRDFLSYFGATTILPNGGGKGQIQWAAKADLPGRLQASFKKGDWNDIELVVRGERMTLLMNGVVCCDVLDNNVARRRMQGLLALKTWITETAESAVVQFRNVRIRDLPSIQDLTIKSRVDLLADEALGAFFPWLGTNAPGQDPQGVYTMSKGVLRVSGEKAGFLYSKSEYAQYRLVAEFRWGGMTSGFRKDQPRNAGIWVHARTGLVLSGQGFECQIREGDTGSLYMFPGTLGRVGGTEKTEPSQRFGRPGLPEGKVKGYRPPDEIEVPHGDWNRFEIICDGKKLRVLVNGKETIRAENVDPASGIIGIESSNAEIFFRKLELLPLEIR